MIFDKFVAPLLENWSNIVPYIANRLFNLGITILEMIEAEWGGDTVTLLPEVILLPSTITSITISAFCSH